MEGQYEILPQVGGIHYAPRETTARHLHNEQLKFKLENVNSRLHQPSCAFHRTQQRLPTHSAGT